MQITPIFLILAAVIGLLVGLLVASLFSPRESIDADQKAPPADMAKHGFSEAVRLWYSPSGNKVITELDGEYYREYLVLSPEQKNRVNKLVVLWSAWAGKLSETDHARVPTPMTSNESPVETTLPPIGPVLDWSVAEALKSEEKEKVSQLDNSLKPKTIAGQISLILEKMLENNPLREKGIKLIENAHQGVDVWIGLEKFDGIEAIPNLEAKQLIRQAVAQWERETEATRNQP